MLGTIPISFKIKETPSFIILDKDKKIDMITFGEEVPLVESEIQKLLIKK